MSFAVAAALSVLVLVAAPLLAHLLRRGRTRAQPFPAASLVPRRETQSRERSRLRDRGLLTLRAAMVVVLAVLGATPLVRCSRLSLDRPSGASIALALVIDDSHSMRAKLDDGATRFEAALDGAAQLLRSLREGDAVAIVLAGKPARLRLSATTHLGAARSALAALQQSDRSGDVGNAVRLAQSALESLEQPDRRTVLLSDLAGAQLEGLRVQVPLPRLREPSADCGIVLAQRRGNRLEVSLACNPFATTPRQLSIVGLDADEILVNPDRMSGLTLAPTSGAQSLSFALRPGAPDFELELQPADPLPDNDRAHAVSASPKLQVAVVTDESQARALTGGPTVIEQALLAVRPEAAIRPLGIMPGRRAALDGYDALVVNDPRGLGPEPRQALTGWVEAGGVVLGLLGPSAARLQLSSTLEPFSARSARWEAQARERSLDAASLLWLAPGNPALPPLARGGRMRLDGALLPGAVTQATWEDGAPFLVSRRLDAGLVLTLGLPASLEQSDLALRPMFLSLLNHLMEAAEERRGPELSEAGTVWSFPAEQSVSVEGPTGPLPLKPVSCAGDDENCSPERHALVAAQAGRYRVDSGAATQHRVVMVDEREIIDAPGKAPEPAHEAEASAGRGSVDASPELALVLLALFALELLVRLLSQARRRRGASGPSVVSSGG